MAVNIGTLTAYLTADLGNLTTGLSKAQKAVKTYSTQVEGFLQANAASIKRLGKQFVVAGTAVTAALGGMVKKFGDFDRAMRQATAATSITEDEYKELANMVERESIRINKSAVEAAEGIKHLGFAGLTAVQQMQAFPPLLRLSKAGMADMGLVTERTLDIMGAYQIEIKRTADVTDFLAKLWGSSRQTLDQLSEAMSYTAATASNANVSLEELGAVTAVLAEAGIKGSRAGTSIRRSILNLIAPTGEMSEQLEALGVSAYNADGSIKPYMQTLKEIFDVLKHATDQQRNMTMRILFGARAIEGQNVIFQKGSEAIEDYVDKLKDAQGTVDEMVDRQLKSFSESMGIIGREIASLFRDIGEKLGPMLLDLGNKVSAIVTKIREWIDAHPELTRNIVEVTAKLAALTIVVGSLTIAIGSLSAIAAVASISLGKIALVLAGASGLIYLIGKATIATAAYAEEMKNVKGQAAEAKTSLEELTNAIKENREELQKTEKGLGYVALTETAQKRIESLNQELEKVREMARQKQVAQLYKLAKAYNIQNLEAAAAFRNDAAAAKWLSGQIENEINKQIAAYQKPIEVLKEKTDKEVAIIKAGEEEKVEVAKQTFEKIGDFEQDRLAALRAIYGEMGKMDREVYDGMIMLLNDQRKEYEKVIKDRALLDRWYNHQKLLLDIELLKSSNRLADGFKAASLQMQLDAKRLGEVMYDITMSMRDSFADAMSDMIWEGKRWQDAMLNFARAVGREITNALAKQAATAIMGGGEGGGLFGGGGGIAGALSTLFGGAKTPIPVGVPGTFPPGEAGVTYTPASVGHEGGRIGITPMPKRSVPKSIFFDAPRLHSGGYLGPDEVPIIGKRKERILTEEQYQDVKGPTIVNNWNVTAMDTQTGMQFIGRNIRGITSMMKLQIRMNDPNLRKMGIL